MGSPKLTFGQFFRKKRTERKDRQSDAAKAIGVTEHTIRSWEHGHLPTAPTIFRVADYLEVKVDELRPYIERAVA